MVDDHPMLRERIVAGLEEDDRLLPVGEAGDGEEALVKIRELEPDVVVLDVFMPKMRADEVLRSLRHEEIDVKVVVLTGSAVAGLHDALEEHPDSLLFKHESCERVCDEIVAVMNGDDSSPGKVTLRHATALAFARVKLTPREQCALELAAQGLKVCQIAARMNVSKTLVNALLQSTRAKLEVNATTAAIAKAYEVGLLKVGWT